MRDEKAWISILQSDEEDENKQKDETSASQSPSDVSDTRVPSSTVSVVKVG